MKSKRLGKIVSFESGFSRRTLALGTTSHYRNARYYEQTYRLRREDVRFYADEAARIGGPVLELGVGTGRVAKAIAARGIAVVGVDASQSMLAQAEAQRQALPKKVRSLLEFRLGDLQTLRLRRRFRLVIAPFNVLMHLYDRASWERALGTVHHHLAPGGRFVFDILNPDPGELDRDPDHTYRGKPVTLPGYSGRFRYGERFEYDPVSQIQLVTMVFDPVGTSAEAPQAVLLTQRQTFPAELETLLHYNGVAIEARYGDFERGPFDEASQSQVVVARRDRRARR